MKNPEKTNTKAMPGIWQPRGVSCRSVISHATNKYPLVEVHINMSVERIEAVFPPPAVSFYPDVQVPLF